MELHPYGEGDQALTKALECDPEVMKDLGGPVDPADIPEVHRRRLQAVDDFDLWFKIVPEPGGPAAGMIGIWPSERDGNPIHEIGWMVLPVFQGRGLASQALRLILDRARSDPRVERIHAFPGTANAPSNALCRKFGFELVEECDVQFRDRALRCNHWELGVR